MSHSAMFDFEFYGDDRMIWKKANIEKISEVAIQEQGSGLKKSFLLFLLIVFLFWFQLSVLWAQDRIDPRYEQRQYRRFVLPNQIKVILISDPTVSHGAASLSVGVGSLSDPPNRQGLAHFLEHMLFLGTKKYPNVDDEKNFLASHDGFSNAFTASESTNYFFRISGNFLEEGLDRFAQFFIAPLFNPEYVKREIEAVHSEYSKNLSNDFRRIYQVERSLYEPNHPAQRFHIGNLDTLKNVTQKELLQFYNGSYSASRMTLAILGKQDLDTLQKWVMDRFVKISNSNLPPVTFPQTYLKKNPLLRLARIEPLKDTRTLHLTFPLPSIRHLYETKPTQGLGYLIGHEGKGSLLSLLKKEGLATGLSAGGGSGSSYGSFRITLQLTSKGLENYQIVMTRVFQYIRLLRKTSFQKPLFEELKRMAEIDFRFKEKEDGTSLVTAYASLLHYIPLSLVETAPYFYKRYDSHLFDSMLFRLTPDNMFVTLVGKGLKTDKVEPYFGARYSYEEGDATFIRELKRAQPHPGLKLPEKNIFIPEKLQLIAPSTPFTLTHQSLVGLKQEIIPQALFKVLETHQGEQWESWAKFSQNVFASQSGKIEPLRPFILKHAVALPEKILNNEQGEVWFQQDIRFRTPKAQLTLLIHTPKVYNSPRSSVLGQLYVSAINEGLNEFGYAVHLAGLNFGVSHGKKGITLSVSGYSDQILDLAIILSAKLKTISIDAPTFASLKERRLRHYQNFQFNQPYQQALYIRSLLLEEKKFSIDQYQQEIKTVTLDELKKYTQSLYQKVYIQGAVNGNLEKDDVRQTITEILNNLSGQPLLQSELFIEKTVQIKKDNYVYSKKTKVDNSAIVFGIQVGKTNPKLRGAMQIISQALRPWSFTELRTQQQLGYTVDAGMSQKEKTLGWMFLLQSGKYPAGVLQERVEAYLPKFLEDFKKLSDAEFENFRQSVINAQLEKSSTIAEAGEHLFYVAFKKDAEFDYVSENIKAIETLTKAEVTQTLEKTLISAHKRHLVIRLVGQSHQDTPLNGITIESFEQFKAEQKIL